VNALQEIQRTASERGLRFVLIGGWAVIQHGYTRVTADLDLLVLRSEQERWRELLSTLGYECFNDSEGFQQYKKPGQEAWPLDLMLVNQETFEGLLAAAAPATVQHAIVPLVSLDHLIALKLHVLKQGRLHRFLKDFEDVIQLVRINRLDLQSAPLRALFMRYGTADLYEKIKRAIES
jgi:predicted nucleotidyltransferase